MTNSAALFLTYSARPNQALVPSRSNVLSSTTLLTSRPDPIWSSGLIYGANDQIGSGRLVSSVVLESTFDLDGTNAWFGRAEYVRKSAAELVIPAVPPTTEYDLGALALGYQRTVGAVAGLAVGVGVRGSLNFVPSSLEAAYGSRTPGGVAIYLQLRPAGARAGGMKTSHD